MCRPSPSFPPTKLPDLSVRLQDRVTVLPPADCKEVLGHATIHEYAREVERMQEEAKERHRNNGGDKKSAEAKRKSASPQVKTPIHVAAQRAKEAGCSETYIYDAASRRRMSSGCHTVVQAAEEDPETFWRHRPQVKPALPTNVAGKENRRCLY